MQAKRLVLISVCLFLTITFAQARLVRVFPGPDGRLIAERTVPDTPPELRVPGPIAVPTRNTVMLSGVPAFDWCYGCFPTSAAMCAAYYDRGNYPNIYSGSTDSGLMPLDNSSWGAGQCPLSATRQGLDGRITQGHVDRFWTGVDNSGDDPWGSSDPTGTYEQCLADYMGTSQDWWNTVDGETMLFSYEDNSITPDFTGHENDPVRQRDGAHGMKLFFESRSYTVSSVYSQNIYGNNGIQAGFTYTQYKNLINAGIPVLIQLDGHSMLGVGYESTNSTIYVHDTWGNYTATMTWGGTYSGKPHYAVTVIILAASPQPLPPSSLHASAVSCNQVNLSWSDNSSNETDFKLERELYNNGIWVQIASLAANTQNYSDYTVPENTYCNYRVRAHNADGYSNYCGDAGAMTPYETPEAPTGLAATATSPTQVFLNWIDNSSNETGFYIERRRSGYAQWYPVGNVNQDIVIYYDNSASANTTYSYRVYAARYNAFSGYSNTAEATTPGPPSAPGNLTATALISSVISLAWSDNSSDETGFKIERKTGAAGTWSEISTVGANVTTFLNAGLNPNTTYYFRVRAYNSGANSTYSNEASATTTEGTTSPPPPWLSAEQAGGTSADLGVALALDSEGNTYVTGAFSSEGWFGDIPLSASGGMDIFIAKQSPDGSWLWAVRAGGTGDDRGQGISLDSSGNVFVTGYFSGTGSFGTTGLVSSGAKDIFVCKLDSGGNWQWASRAGGGSDDEGADLIVGSGAGFIYVTGYFKGTAGFGTTNLTSFGDGDIYLGVLGALGSWVAALKAGGPLLDKGLSLIRDSAGNLYMTGSFCGTSTFGTFSLTSYGLNDVFLAKFNNAGSLVGVVQAGGSDTDYGTDLGLDSAGNVFLTGCFSGNATFGTTTMTSSGWTDIFVGRVNTEGFLTGVVRAGGTGFDYGHSIAVDDNGDCYVAGVFEGISGFGANTLTSRGFNDIFASKLDGAGNWLWVQQAGGTANDYSYAIALDGDDICHLTGYYISNPAVFGGFSLPSSGNGEICLARLGFAPPPAPASLTAAAMSDSRIDLAWSDNSAFENGFVIERKTGPSGSWAEVGSTGENVSSFSDIGLESGTSYYYRVRAYNATGNSGYTNEAGATTYPAAPSGLSITRSGPNVQISWGAVAGASSYYVYQSNDPYSGNWGAPIAQTAVTAYIGFLSSDCSFYRITASSDGLKQGRSQTERLK